MALPHLPSAYTARRNIYEEAMVTRRNRESDFRERWGHNADYFHRNNVAASKKQAWESNASFQHSMDAYKAAHVKEQKMLSLQRRRLQLAKMLAEERDELYQEMKELVGGRHFLLDEMKGQCETIKSAREEKRKQLANEKMYEHWRMNSPDVRQMESNEHKKFIVNKWEVQRSEKKEREEKERLEREELERQMEEGRQRALDLEWRKEEEKLVEARRRKEELQDQMMELKEREAETKQLKEQEELLLKQKWELHRIEEERRQKEAESLKVEFGRVLLRQHAAALRRRSQQIQKELEEDRKFLERLAEQEEQDREIATARRERARADAGWMKKVIEEQIKTEKSREAELDLLYQDEAARIWEQREAEWAKEKMARERLMKEVMVGRQEQIEAKMDAVKRQQEESIERREELLNELELVNQMTQREAKEKEAQRETIRRDLDAQMTARREKEDDLRLELQLDDEEEKHVEEEYEEMLKREAQQLSVRGYQPKPFGRKQAWM